MNPIVSEQKEKAQEQIDHLIDFVNKFTGKSIQDVIERVKKITESECCQFREKAMLLDGQDLSDEAMAIRYNAWMARLRYEYTSTLTGKA